MHSFSSVQSFSRVQLFATPWTAAHQASLSITNSLSLLKLMSIRSVMPSNCLIFCRPHLLLPSIFPSIRVFPNESVLCIRLPKLWSFSFSISPSNEYAFICTTHIHTHIYSTHHHWFPLVQPKTLMIMYKTSQGQSPSPHIPTPVQSERVMYSIHNKVNRWDLWLPFTLG